MDGFESNILGQPSRRAGDLMGRGTVRKRKVKPEETEASRIAAEAIAQKGGDDATSDGPSNSKHLGKEQIHHSNQRMRAWRV